MYLKSFVVRNFRRLKRARVDLSEDTTIFVGANNSGKTSATHIFHLFLRGGKFTIYDFSADCWNTFNEIGRAGLESLLDIPAIWLDLWFDVDDENLHRVIDLLPDLSWQDKPVGVRISFEPRDPVELYRNFSQSRDAAVNVPSREEGPKGGYQPWPRNLHDYLSRRLDHEYHVVYYKLDIDEFDNELDPGERYQPPRLDGGAKIVESIIRIDFLDAQRYLTDTEARGRAEELSRRMSRFYMRNLQKQDPDPEALRVLAESESRLNEHFANVFKPTLDSLSKMGYPGFANPKLLIKTTLKPDGLLSSSAQVHYAMSGVVPDGGTTLPDRYSGLGFKNLIYMVIEILDFHHAWVESAELRPPVHLILIEEPESHLHAQIQQVFVRQVREIVGDVSDGHRTQFVLTTHSSHIVYEDFRSIRYFCRIEDDGNVHRTDVKNLSTFYDGEEESTRTFLLQYLKLTHCDLFFADAAVLVEGNVERLLLPLIIGRNCRGLEACHLTVLEVGGAFAHKFRKLIDFIGLTCLVITDLDSVQHAVGTAEETNGDEGLAPKRAGKMKACRTDVPNALTSNETLKQWLPGMASVEDLLNLDPKLKATGAGGPFTASVRVAYQTKESVIWGGVTHYVAGRTFEEAFALQNLEWIQQEQNSSLGLRVKQAKEDNFDSLVEEIFEKVRTLDKTSFALALMTTAEGWVTPAYIIEGLEWLAEQVGVSTEMPSWVSLRGESA